MGEREQKKHSGTSANPAYPDKLGFRTYLGTTAMSLTDAMGAALMTSWFMVYLTDYAGLGAFGAVVGSSILLFSRIFDAVNDPLEGWIMDRAKVGKHGKYKPFIILSILLTSVGISCLFFVPAGTHVVLTCLWVIFFYLVYDVGASFYAPNLVYRTLTLDPNQRGKMMIAPRFVSMLLGMITAGLIGIVNAVDAGIGDMHTSFGLTVTALIGITAILSLLGISLVREKHHAPREESGSKTRVRLRDFFLLLKENKALRVRILDMTFSGFIWTFLFATMLYYIKWGLCTDLTTGQVDSDAYGVYSLVSSMMMFLPLLLGTAIAVPLMKKAGSPMRFHRILLLLQAAPCGLLFLFQVIGVLRSTPALFFLCTAITAVAVGCDFIPGESINIECMDYEIYQNGKDRSALCNAFNKFINKAQSALAGSLIGFLLVAIGYVVDSRTGDFAGDITRIPHMLTWFIVIMGLLPCLFGLIAWLVTRSYPVTDEIRSQMKEQLLP
ncbi:MAG: MFS transporter [Eubacteriales bacterium]|nr:MFS transporter [Eubacteriales bacterium]